MNYAKSKKPTIITKELNHSMYQLYASKFNKNNQLSSISIGISNLQTVHDPWIHNHFSIQPEWYRCLHGSFTAGMAWIDASDVGEGPSLLNGLKFYAP